MAVRDIVLYPDHPLLEKAAPVENIGPEIARLVADLYQTMDAYDGCGLAAPQVGVQKRLLVLREPDAQQPMCLINPEIADGEGTEVGEEGCLSIPSIFAPVSRYTRIRVRALDGRGTFLDFVATDMLARIIQHELDHLDGVLFIDRLDILTREAKLREWKEAREQLSSALTGAMAVPGEGAATGRRYR